MTNIAELQARADKVAATLNRVVLKTDRAPATIEKVAMLHLARSLFEKLTAPGQGFSVLNAEEVGFTLARIENECRTQGLYERFADLPRNTRRRMQRIAGEIK